MKGDQAERFKSIRERVHRRNQKIFEPTLELAVEIAREGREGRRIGTIFTFGDASVGYCSLCCKFFSEGVELQSSDFFRSFAKSRRGPHKRKPYRFRLITDHCEKGANYFSLFFSA